MQGPYAPELVPWIRHHARSFDVVVFITYLYWTTWAGLRACAGAVPTLLHPTAHDEPPLRLSIFEEVFRTPDAFAFLTPEEVDLVRAAVPRRAARRRGRHRRRDGPADGDADAFRRRYGLGDAPYLLYVGRVDPAKGAAELIDYFVAYKNGNAERPQARAARRAARRRSRPRRHRRHRLRRRGDPQRRARRARALVHPSYFESFSMVLTEAFAQRRPALVQRRCDGARRATPGAAAAPSRTRGFAEFEAAVELLRTSPELADAMGAAGRRYVEQEYDWDVVTPRYERILERVAGRSSGPFPSTRLSGSDQTLAGGSSSRRPRRTGHEVGEQADRDHLERGEQDEQRVGGDVQVQARRCRRSASRRRSADRARARPA